MCVCVCVCEKREKRKKRKKKKKKKIPSQSSSSTVTSQLSVGHDSSVASIYSWSYSLQIEKIHEEAFYFFGGGERKGVCEKER